MRRRAALAPHISHSSERNDSTIFRMEPHKTQQPFPNALRGTSPLHGN
jgi:hypothetical protein